MAPTRMKLRLRRRDGTAGGSNAAGGAAGPAEEEEERGRESSSSRSRRKKNSSSSSAAPSSAAPSSSPPTSSASARAAAAAAAEEASPDSKCPICLDRFNNLAYLDRCLHRFCFPCIQEWSHNKAECPLCKQPFASILHSVRAEDDFKEYTPRPTHSHSNAASAAADDNAGERGLGAGDELGERGPMYEGVRIVRNNQVRLILQRLRAGLGGGAAAARRRRARADADADELSPVATLMRNAQQLRLMLRGLRAVQGGDATTATARRRRERGGRGGGGGGGGGGGRGWERRREGEWYLPPLLALPPLPHHPTFSPDADEDGQEEEERGLGPGEELGERGVIFDGLTGLGGAVAPVAPNDRSSRRLMTRLAARRRLQQEGGSVRRLRERETLAFRRALYRSGVRVRGVAGGNQGQQQRDVTAETYRRNPGHLNRLRPWLRRELTVLYGAHGSLVDIVQRIIMARLAHHGLEDTPTIEEELRPFLLARTEHFLHELLSFARSPLSLENYDLQAVYEPPAAAMELDTVSSSTDDSVIAISEGEGEEEGGGGRGGGGRSEETQFALAEGAHDDVIQTGSSLSLSAWDDETPGPSYSTAEPSHSLAPLSVSPAREEGANEEAEAAEGEERRDKKEEGEEEEECLIVGYVKPMAERTPELVQLSSDTEEDEPQQQEEEKEKKKEEEEKKEEARTTEAPPPPLPLPPLPSVTSPLSSLPTIPPSTSTQREREGRSWSGSSGRSSPSPGGKRGEVGRRARERRKERERDRGRYPESTERRSKKRKRRAAEEGRLRRRDSSGGRGLYSRSIYPAVLRRSQSPSPFLSSSESRTMSPPSPPASPWELHRSGPSSLSSSTSSLSSSGSSPSSWCSSPLPPLPASLSPSVRGGGGGGGDKPGGKRKYKSRHLDDDVDDPTWQPASGRRGDKRGERRGGGGGGERESKRRGRDGGRRRERGRRDAHRENSVYDGESSRGCREGRSPSVEIIYEGTITSTTPRPPAHKRHRKRHRKTRRSSSPVVITIDSDSSRDDVNNSSPLSSQAVDFSDLPPLPLVDSGGVGRHLGGDISELPVDILDRGSDRSEAELDSRSKVVDPVALDDSDSNSDDLDNREDAGCLLARDDTEGNSNAAIGHNKASPADRRSPVAKPVATTAAAVSRSFVNVPTCREAVVPDFGSQPVGEGHTGLVARDRSVLLDRERETEAKQKDSGFANSDTGLLATILNDLEGISEPKRELAFNIDPEHSRDSRKRLPGGQGRLNQNSWVAEEKMVVGSGDVHLPDLNSPECQAIGSPSPTHRPSFPPPPPLQRLKEREVCEEARDLPPPLKHGPPVSSSSRNAPSLLKHKDESSPRHRSISPVSPVDPHLHPADTQSPPFVSNSTRFNSDWDAVVSSGSVAVIPPTDLRSSSAVSPVHPRAAELPANDRSIPPIVTLKRRFADAAASREDRASASRVSSVDLHSSCHLPPADSHSKASGGSKSRVSAVDCNPMDSHSPGSRSGSTLCADRLPPLDFLSFPGFSSGRGSPPTVNSKEIPPSSPGISPVNSVSSVDFCSSTAGCPKETPAQGSSTSQAVRKETEASCRLAPVGSRCTSQESPFDLCPPGGVSAKETPASSDAFSGVDLDELPPPVCVSLVDTGSGNSSSPTDFRSSFGVSSRERLSERCASSGVGSKGKPASDTGLSKTDLNPKSHKFPSDLHSSSTASERTITSTSPRSPIDFLSPERHCNSTASSASPSAASRSTRRESGSTSRLATDSRSQPQHPTNTCSQPQFPLGAHSKPSRRDSSFCHIDNHVAPHPQASVENQWNPLSSVDAHSDAQSPMDEHPAGRPDTTSSIWNKHTHSLQLD